MFHQINDTTEISLAFVTCSDYQLFVDYTKKSEQYSIAPDYWINDRFLKGTASSAVSISKPSNIEKFCRWLTHQNFSVGYIYRLPTIEESASFPLQRISFDYWCSNQEVNLYTIASHEKEKKREVIAESHGRKMKEAKDLLSLYSIPFRNMILNDDSSSELQSEYFEVICRSIDFGDFHHYKETQSTYSLAVAIDRLKQYNSSLIEILLDTQKKIDFLDHELSNSRYLSGRVEEARLIKKDAQKLKTMAKKLINMSGELRLRKKKKFYEFFDSLLIRMKDLVSSVKLIYKHDLLDKTQNNYRNNFRKQSRQSSSKLFSNIEMLIADSDRLFDVLYSLYGESRRKSVGLSEKFREMGSAVRLASEFIEGITMNLNHEFGFSSLSSKRVNLFENKAFSHDLLFSHEKYTTEKAVGTYSLSKKDDLTELIVNEVLSKFEINQIRVNMSKENLVKILKEKFGEFDFRDFIDNFENIEEKILIEFICKSLISAKPYHEEFYGLAAELNSENLMCPSVFCSTFDLGKAASFRNALEDHLDQNGYISIEAISLYSLLTSLTWNWLGKFYQKEMSRSTMPEIDKDTELDFLDKIDICVRNQKDSLNMYAFFLMIVEQMRNEISIPGSIRLVREKVL